MLLVPTYFQERKSQTSCTPGHDMMKKSIRSLCNMQGNDRINAELNWQKKKKKTF